MASSHDDCVASQALAAMNTNFAVHELSVAVKFVT